jgi:TRAP-type C4-dicarboxylate transport system permease small subunit
VKKFIGTILRAQEVLGTFLLSIFFLAIILQIGARYMKIPLLWTEELANYSFIWAVFMGASAMVYHKAHFCFTFFSDRFKNKRGAAYDIFLSLVVLSFTVSIFLYGITIARTFWHYNWISLPWVKMGYTWLCVPIMGFTMSLYTVNQIWENIQALMDRGTR